MTKHSLYSGVSDDAVGTMADVITEGKRREALLTAEALQSAIFNSANFSSIATDARGVIQIFNVGAELGAWITALSSRATLTPSTTIFTPSFFGGIAIVMIGSTPPIPNAVQSPDSIISRELG